MNLKNLNLKYALVNIGFMLLISGSIGFAYNYLSQVGFSAGTIGTTMSVMSLIGVFLGPAAGDLVDRSDRITQKAFISGSMVLCAILGITLLLIPAGSPLILPIVVVMFSSSMVGMPMLNSMAFIYEKFGGTINYGLCRGLGSAAYAVGSNVVGRLWASLGTNTLPIVVIVGSLFTMGMALLMPSAPRQQAHTTAAKGESSISVLQFFSKYRQTVPVVVALVLLYFCHNIVNTYMGAILGVFVPEGDVELVQGNALFIQAMVELPVMFGFTFIMRKLSINRILAIAAVFYSIKHVLVLVSNNDITFYAAMVLQMLSYAAITPAIVYYANQQVSDADQNKSQAIFITANSVGSLLASFVGGWMFELIGVHAGLVVGVAASVVGTVLMIWGTRGNGAVRAR